MVDAQRHGIVVVDSHQEHTDPPNVDAPQQQDAAYHPGRFSAGASRIGQHISCPETIDAISYTTHCNDNTPLAHDPYQETRLSHSVIAK